MKCKNCNGFLDYRKRCLKCSRTYVSSYDAIDSLLSNSIETIVEYASSTTSSNSSSSCSDDYSSVSSSDSCSGFSSD